ncbi:unnamed protein product [Owenia fusiformis]|uniref:SOCS box domain-containing protein n=1 Tax=Owenia fusiformis TaxID=6347 RepID=A0A8S4NJZ1_OWEFU|nr:unnamed protein product [Owenia fusiformis]
MLPSTKRRPDQSRKAVEFFNAVRSENVKKVKMMIGKREFDVNEKDVADKKSPTPLLIAAEKGNFEIVKLLLKAKPRPADVNAQDKTGKRAIWYAARYGHKEMAEWLLGAKGQECEVDYLDPASGCTPLFTGILANHADVCRMIIHAGADVNLRRLGFNENSESPLIKAIQMDNLEIVDMLCNSLCNMEAKTEDGLTALHYAVAYRRYDITEYLLENSVKIQAETHQGVTAMAISVEHFLPAMCRILIEFGYKMNKAYKWKETPLEHAIKLHSEDCAMIMVQWGCKLKHPNRKISYFELAIKEGLIRLAKLMIQIRPEFLQEPWVKQKHIHLSIYKKPEFYKLIFELSKSPLPLFELCRSQIFKHLGKYAVSKVKKLPIPEKMKDFLRCEEHFSKDAYEKVPLDKKECPFDCPSYCDSWDCPPIDIEPDDTELDL